ncbi:MAG: hypothetical protein HC888_00430 [Candidatus Competibacteraceae bacterium]|nr:hypothetical protein [Candidatus Competibacteraceae bacterium]
MRTDGFLFGSLIFVMTKLGTESVVFALTQTRRRTKPLTAHMAANLSRDSIEPRSTLLGATVSWMSLLIRRAFLKVTVAYQTFDQIIFTENLLLHLLPQKKRPD